MLINKNVGWSFILNHIKGNEKKDKDSLYIEIKYDDRPSKESLTKINMDGSKFEYDGPEIFINLDENDRLVGIEIL